MQERERVQRWAWLVEQADGLRRSLRGLTAHDADEIAQEAMLRAALSSRVVPAGSHGVAWLHRIARNIAIDRWRRERRTVSLDIAEHVPAEAETSAGAIDVDIALTRLRPGDRRLLSLIASGMGYSDLAHGEGVEASVIRQRVARARARLLAQLREE